MGFEKLLWRLIVGPGLSLSEHVINRIKQKTWLYIVKKFKLYRGKNYVVYGIF